MAALRVIVCACSVLWVWRSRVTNQIEPRIMISLSDVLKPNRTVGWYSNFNVMNQGGHNKLVYLPQDGTGRAFLP